jgi:hypothetical protein
MFDRIDWIFILFLLCNNVLFSVYSMWVLCGWPRLHTFVTLKWRMYSNLEKEKEKRKEIVLIDFNLNSL